MRDLRLKNKNEQDWFLPQQAHDLGNSPPTGLGKEWLQSLSSSSEEKGTAVSKLVGMFDFTIISHSGHLTNGLHYV